MTNHTRVKITALALAIMSQNIHAAVTSYTDLSSFSAAANSLSLVTFEGNDFAGLSNGGNLWNTNNPAGFTLAGATFSVAGGTNYEAIVAPAYAPSLYDRGTGNVMHTESDQALTITFASPVSAMALDLSTIFRSSGNVAINFSNGDMVLASLGDPFAFHGYTTDTSFNSVTIGARSGDYLLIDNVRFGNAVPEPTSLLLLGGGLLGLGARRRR